MAWHGMVTPRHDLCGVVATHITSNTHRSRQRYTRLKPPFAMNPSKTYLSQNEVAPGAVSGPVALCSRSAR